MTAAVGVAAALCVLGAFAGGYYPRSWGWASLAALTVGTGLLVTSRRLALGGGERVVLGALGGLAAWTAVSAMRNGAATRGVPALQRELLYLSLLWTALLLLRRVPPTAVLAGVLAGAVALTSYGLERYLLGSTVPNRYEGRLVYEPLGYANAQGVLAAMGAALALGITASTRSRLGSAAAAASLVPLAAGLAGSSSRGAQGAFLLGLGVMLLIDRPNGSLLASCLTGLPLPLLAVALQSGTRLGDQRAPADLVAHQGRLLAGALVLLTVAQFAVGWALRDRRIRTSRRVVAVAATVCCAAPVLAAVTMTGSLGDRPAYWRAALTDVAAHPLLGSGAGSFEVAWLRYRSIPVATRTAHSLYLETLSELGPVGLTLLLLVLATPLIVLARRRGTECPTTAAAGAYVIFVTHAALDWDWQMPVVVLVALTSAATLLVPATGLPSRRLMRRRLGGVLLATLAVWVIAAVGVAATTRLDAGIRAAGSGDLATAAAFGRSAGRLEPWSAEPHVFGGDVALARGDRRAARREFAAALRLDPNDWQTWLELARLSSPAEARAALARAAALNPLMFPRR